MKKRFLTLSALIVLGITSNAQIRVGVQAGVNVNAPKISGIGTALGKKITSVSPGLVIDIPMFNGLSFKPSFNYLQTTANSVENYAVPANLPFSPAYNAQDVTAIKMNNIQIPLDINIPIKMKNGKLLLSAGPIVTIGIKANANLNTTNLTNNSTVTALNVPLQFGGTSADVKKVDWGSRFGVGYGFKKGIDLMLQYKYGFTDLLTDNNSNYKSHILSLTASWFLIGNKNKK